MFLWHYLSRLVLRQASIAHCSLAVPRLGVGLLTLLLVAALNAASSVAGAQCLISVERLGDPRLYNPRFMASGDPDGAGPMPEQLLVSSPDFSSSGPLRIRIITGQTEVVIPNVSFELLGAVMYQGSWILQKRNPSPTEGNGIFRWDGTELQNITPVVGIVHGFEVFQGELYFVVSQQNTTFTGQIVRWNGSRSEVVGRTTLRTPWGVRASFTVTESSLFIAGPFALIENVPIDRVARWNVVNSSGTWSSPQFPSSLSGVFVRSLATLNDVPYLLLTSEVGSNFVVLNPGSPAWTFARDATTPTRGPSSSSSLAKLLSAGGFIYAFTNSQNEGFTNSNGVQQGFGFFRWNGTNWLDMTGLAPSWREIKTLPQVRSSMERIDVVPFEGHFAFIAGLSRGRLNREIAAIMLWNGTEFLLQNKGISGEIRDVVEFEGDSIVCGYFDYAGGRSVEGIARWDGETFHPLESTPIPSVLLGFQGAYFSQVHVMNGELYVAGDFSLSYGAPPFISTIARWNGFRWIQVLTTSAGVGPVWGLDSIGSTLIAGDQSRYIEVTNSVRRLFEGTVGYGFAQRDGLFYASSVSAGRVGVREAPGVFRWVTPFVSSGGPDRLLAFRDEVFTFGGGPYQVGSSNERTSVQRILPDGRVRSEGTWYNELVSIVSGDAVEFQGDVWWGKALRSSNDRLAPLVRWNGVEMLRPSIFLNNVDVTTQLRWGRTVAKVQAADGIDELWLHLQSTSGFSDNFPPLFLRYRASPPPVITLQPVTPTLLPGQAATFSFATQSSEGVTFAWRFNNVALTDGYLPGLGLVSGSRTPTLTIEALERFDGKIEALATTNCGTSYTNAVALASRACDSIDFNNDTLFPSDEDLIDFLSVLAGGECSPGNTCNDIDFNNDGLFPSDDDLLAFLRVLAGGSC
jgi:hypothetical protein